MKVMHFIHGFNTGGAETLVKEYALRLDKKKFDIVLLCLEHYYDSPYEKLLKDNNIRMIFICDYMKFYNKKSIIFRIINYIQRYLLVKKIIHLENPDVLHTHLKINSFIKFAKPNKDVRIYHTIHSNPLRYWPSKKNKDFKAVKWLVSKYNMTFICLHEEMRKQVNYMFNVKNTVVLNNGIDFLKFENVSSKVEVRSKLNIPMDAYVVGHVGRFDKVKNHEFLIDVFSEIHKNNSKAFLLMIGSGEERKNIEKKLQELNLAKSYMILSNRADIPDLLNVMNIFVFPSFCEGLPLSLIEAQKMLLPCFVSDTITKSVMISNLVTYLSIKSSAKQWSCSILKYKFPQNILLNDKEWNINFVMKQLEGIYLENKKLKKSEDI